jgi:2-phosphosulfolactate phosphatase
MIFDQAEFEIRCEWGEQGVKQLAPDSDAVIIVDVLSFSTAVEIATARGATIFPYRWRDESAVQYAHSLGARLADKRGSQFSLAPASLINIPAELKLVLPSPNGATLSLLTGTTPTLLGCLRNCRAVAQAAARLGKRIALIPAGERWEDGSLRPAYEDWLGAGAIISFLAGARSPEAGSALAAWHADKEQLTTRLRQCSSGKELLERRFEADVELAAQLNVSSCVPILQNGAFIAQPN